MQRGDLVTVIAPGAYGKPRPALVIQSDLFARLPSLSILLVTTTLRDTPLIRFQIDPSPENNLNKTSQVMIDKIMTVPKEKIGTGFGKVSENHLKSIERLMAVFLGIA